MAGADGSGVDASRDGANLVACGSDNPSFPTFDKSCDAATDCLIGLHQVDCCGSLVAIGIRASERDRFQADEARCVAMYPGCDCAGRPTLAEDGHTGTYDRLVVRCDGGRCMTTFP
jgi:hypothetical protein